jgi:CheY-like chemotaxis protein
MAWLLHFSMKSAAMLLIVDDDRLLREALSDFLDLQGPTVHCTANGREAIEWFKGRQTYPDLIFLELVMPVLDGWGFLIERRQNPVIRIIPVVVMSGSLAIADRATAAGAVHVMRKPFGAEELLPVIEQFLVAA